MAGVIKILPEAIANKIAAGEVVQRPASVVKELVENSIDAGATSLTVIVNDGGTSLIQVVDDGLGMTPEDAAIAFERHATSKIATYEDLENIRTLGFRGEALSSIGAVARVVLRTRMRSAETCTAVRYTGGVLEAVTEEAGPPGTSVTVKNLFFNTPGRRNFLKSTSTEFKHIADVIQRTALACPALTLKFVSDGETIFQFPAAPLAERVAQVLGEKLARSLITFSEESPLLGVQGFLGRPEFARRGRTDQYLFLNGRSIVHRGLGYAVSQAYEHLLEKGSFPVFILLLRADPHSVDVNVHPTKMEVKFEDESSVYRMVSGAVRGALAAHDLIPDAGIRPVERGPGIAFLRDPSPVQERGHHWADLFAGERTSRGSSAPEASQPPLAHAGEAGRVTLLQVHNKYIVMPTDTGIMLIDQHAAHERVIYERAVKRMNEAAHESQQLLFPQTIAMKPGDVALVGQLLPILESMGFALKLFGKDTVILEGVPTDLRAGDEKTILQDLLDLFKEDEQRITLEPRERLAQSYACRAAIKRGDPLKEEEIRSLLDQLFATEIPYSCPHGRPVLIRLTLPELDRRFGRTS